MLDYNRTKSNKIKTLLTFKNYLFKVNELTNIF